MANLNNGAIVCKKVTTKFYPSDTDLSGSSPGLRGRQYRQTKLSCSQAL